MENIDIVGLDLAKHLFQVHAVAADATVVLKRQLRRSQLLSFFAKLPPCLVGLEACGGAHFWAREIAALGHQVRLMPPAYVKAYVKRGKTDAGDAEAICEAVSRPTMRFVPIKSAAQQAAAMRLKTRASRAPAQSARQRVASAPLGTGHRRRQGHRPRGRTDRNRAR